MQFIFLDTRDDLRDMYTSELLFSLLFFFKICFISMWIDTRTLSRDLDSRIDKRRLIFADPPLRVTQTKKGPLYCKKCLRSCFVNGQFNFVASNKQRPAKRMYLPNRARNLAFNVPFHANCHGKS